MIVKTIHVRNFRCLLDSTIDCDNLTVLVGANGSGKSSFLRALELFYAATPSIELDDFYAEDTSNDIEVTLTFIDLNKHALEHFSSYLDDRELTVTQIFSLRDGKLRATYHGSTLQNPDFNSIRSIAAALEMRQKYNDLSARPEYSELPTAQSKEAVLSNLRTWELQHQDRCVRQRDDGQFFGFKEVAQGYLGRYTRLISIPAVRDASQDSSEGKGSPITELMDLVVRSVLAGRKEFLDLREELQSKYQAIMDPANMEELRALGGDLTRTLQLYVPDAAVQLTWAEGGAIDLPLPKAKVKLVEDNYPSAVERTGHGLQRAYILTMLQHLAIARSAPTQPEGSEASSETGSADPGEQGSIPDLILAIEEPELYQHPNRQRHMANILLDLASGTLPGVVRKTQVIYGTHSPLFLGIDRFDQIRLLRKVQHSKGKPKIAVVQRFPLENLADALWEATGKSGEKFTAESTRARLQVIMTPWMNEGFFADVVVLVEGEGDRAAILGTAKALELDFERAGIALIPCMGKNNLDRPLLIFNGLNINTYVIWDGDYGDNDASTQDNRYLLRLLKHGEDDWPELVSDKFSCFKSSLDATLRSELGEALFKELITEQQNKLGIRKRDQAVKNARVISAVIAAANERGHKSATLEEIVLHIVALKTVHS